MLIKVLKTAAKEKLKKKTNIDFSEIEKKVKQAEEGGEIVPRNNLLKDNATDQTVTVKDKKIKTKKGEETATQVNVEKNNIKVKDVDQQADEVLEDLKVGSLNQKITQDILRDFNINKINSEDDIKALIEQISTKFAKDINKQKRGVKTNKVTKQLATLLNKNENDLASKLLTLQPGSTLNAETIFAARELLVASLNKLDTLAKAAERGGTAELIAFRQHFALTAELQKVIKGVQTETARALQQFKIQTREVGQTNIRLDELRENDLIVELGGDGATRTLARLYLDSGNATKRLSFAQQTGVFANIQKSADAVTESFLNIILSNPMTHVRNTAGNWISQAIVQTERKLATMMPGGGGRDIDNMAMYEDIAKAFGKHQQAIEMHQAIAKSLTSLLKGEVKGADIKPIFKGNKLDSANQVNAATAANFNIENKTVGSIVDVIGSTITLGRVPTKFLTFADNYFKNIEYRGELYALGFRDAMKKIELGALDQKDAADYIADFVINPTKDAVKEAYDAAHYATFQTKKRGDWLDGVTKVGQGIKENSGWFKWWTNYYLPFVRTPTNIGGFALERTPVLQFTLKSFRDDMAAGGHRRQKALAKMALGHTFFAMMAPLGYMNKVNGSFPLMNKKNKRDIQKLEGDISKSFDIGDWRISTVGMDPLAQMMGQAADLGQLAHYIVDDPKNWESYTQFTLGMILSFGENLSNSTYMQGVANFAEDWTYGKQAYMNDSDDKFLRRYFSRYAATFVPTGVKQVGKWFEDENTAKISKEFDELLLRNLKENSARIDFNIIGEPVYEIGFLNKVTKTPVTEELKRVNPKFPKINKYWNYSDPSGVNRIFPQSVEMTSEEESVFKEFAGKLALNGGFQAPPGSTLTKLTSNNVVDGFQKMFESDYYKNAPKALQEAYINATISASRTAAKSQLKQDPTIMERVTEEGRFKLADYIINKEQSVSMNDNINNDN